MSKNIRTQIGKVIGKTLNSYHARVKPVIDDIKFKEQYQGRIIDCMVGEVDDNYIETPETDSAIVKLEHSKEGLVKVPSIKGKTILVDSDGNETDTPGEGCKLVSVGEEEDNKLIILSKNKNLFDKEKITINNMYQITKHSIKDDSLSLTFTSYNGWGGFKYDDLDITKTYTISFIPSGNLNECRIGWYVGEVFNQRRFNTINTICKITITNTDSFSIQTNMSVGGTVTFSNIQVEEGSNQTSYIVPKSHKTEILLNKPLRSLPNGVCDEIVGNKIIRRVGKMSFSDLNKIKEPTTIVWGTGNSHGAYQWEDMASFNGTGSNIINYKHRDNKITPNIVNNLYPYDTSWHGGNSNGSPQGLLSVFFGISNDGHIRLMVSKSLINPTEPSTVGDTEFKTWVENNLNLDAEFIYELEEPIIEELPNGIILQGFDDTTIYIENSIIPTVSYGYNALIPYKEELSKQKEEVETNTLDIENNIIPYLMDMEFNLMLMEDNE